MSNFIQNLNSLECKVTNEASCNKAFNYQLGQ